MLSFGPTFFPPEELITLARRDTLFYGKLYEHLPARLTLADLPLTEQADYWQAYAQDNRSVLTAPLDEGIVLNSGGTTGAPKYSYFSNREWDTTIALSARAYESAGLRDGDRVANLFAGGNLYGSFIFATESLKWTKPKVLQLPLGYAMDTAPAVRIIQTFKPNVLAGFPSHLIGVIQRLADEPTEGLRIERILYAGELFSSDRAAFVQRVFPGVEIRSVGYASVDAGLIGYADAACAPGEHRVFDEASYIEILDDATGQPIAAPGVPGRIVFTNLTRTLMPFLRYPTGDRGEWTEPEGAADRKFKLLGRWQEAARLATYTVGVAEVAGWLEAVRERTSLREYQLLVTTEDRIDRLTLRLAGETASPEDSAEASAQVLRSLNSARPDLAESAAAGIIHPPRVEWVREADLIRNERTGKLLQVVDRRGR